MSLISLDKVEPQKKMNAQPQRFNVDEMNISDVEIEQYVCVDENVTTITDEGITEIVTPEFTTETVTKTYEQIESSIKQFDVVISTYQQIQGNFDRILNMDSNDKNKYPLLRESANRLLSPSSFITSLINAEFGNKQYTDEELNKIRTDYTNQYNAYLKEKVNAELARINPDTNPEYYSALKDIADGNITFSEQYSNIENILMSAKKIRYDLVQEAKKKDYDLLATTDEYKNYIGDLSMEAINTSINSWVAPYTMYDGTTGAPYTADNTSKIAEFRIFLTDEQKQMYYYLHETKGYAKAEE